MQVVDALPTSSNPLSHEYVSPTELPVDITPPLVGSVGSAQRAENKVYNEDCPIKIYYSYGDK